MKILINDYLELCKPRVVILMILTSVVGICLAPSPTFPFIPMIFGNIGIALLAGAAATLNHVADQHIDKLMGRTKNRPIAKGKISVRNSLIFSFSLTIIGLITLLVFINPLTAVLTFLSLMGYAGCYTLYLKHATPQNIVIGGIAGAAPPLLGWVAVTGSISADALLLVLIIYIWTPPHFWALAIARYEDYAKADIPMLPNTHGIAYTKLNIVLYTALLVCASLLPYVINMSGLIYLVGVSGANLVFIYYVIKLYKSDKPSDAMATFWYSIHYLGLLFIFLLIDHYFHF